jgi:hypothetical protein
VLAIEFHGQRQEECLAGGMWFHHASVDNGAYRHDTRAIPEPPVTNRTKQTPNKEFAKGPIDMKTAVFVEDLTALSGRQRLCIL